jgi:nucleotide-binding universal stress UspA family protein
MIIKDGVPFEEILKVVDNEEAGLLVMNSRGRTNLADYLFGTTAEKTFRHCPVPVLTINLRQ